MFLVSLAGCVLLGLLIHGAAVAQCGNGTVEAGEECDGTCDAGLQCSPSCNCRDFIVDTIDDIPDANPGDGTCAAVPGTDSCSLRAAIQEANAYQGGRRPVTIELGPGTYDLTIPPDDAADEATGDLDMRLDGIGLLGEGRGRTRRLHLARLRDKGACIEDLDYRQTRGLDRALVRRLSTGEWVTKHQNVIVTGKTGCGKTFVACALGQKVCRDGYTAIYRRVPHLVAGRPLSENVPRVQSAKE